MKRSDLLIVALAVVMLAVALMPLVAVDAGGDGTPTPDYAATEQAKAATAEAIPATPDAVYVPVIGACDLESPILCYPNGAEFP